MKIIECWSIGIWDGGDRAPHKYYVATEEAAQAWKAKNQYDSVTSHRLVVFDDLAEIVDYEKGEARRRALAKLTPEEKFALGLDKAI